MKRDEGFHIEYIVDVRFALIMLLVGQLQNIQFYIRKAYKQF